MADAAEPDNLSATLGHRHAARVRRVTLPGLSLTIQRATPFTGARVVAIEDTVEESLTLLSEARQTVKAFRKEAGTPGRRLSPRQWKRAKRLLRRDGLL